MKHYTNNSKMVKICWDYNIRNSNRRPRRREGSSTISNNREWRQIWFEVFKSYRVRVFEVETQHKLNISFTPTKCCASWEDISLKWCCFRPKTTRKPNCNIWASLTEVVVGFRSLGIVECAILAHFCTICSILDFSCYNQESMFNFCWLCVCVVIHDIQIKPLLVLFWKMNQTSIFPFVAS